MTKRQDTEIARCVCGCKAKLHGCEALGPSYWVLCSSGEISGEACWFGPTRKTAVDAVRAWNRVMEAVDIVRIARKRGGR